MREGKGGKRGTWESLQQDRSHSLCDVVTHSPCPLPCWAMPRGSELWEVGRGATGRVSPGTVMLTEDLALFMAVALLGGAQRVRRRPR